jgi:beta-lactam-binding protein with PASTA domain/tRNA A-37 threonylcarbamoyl transferase component Bud32
MTQSGSGAPLVGGRYQLGELLGRGGMAEVRKGTDTRLGRTVAVKRLRTDLASDATFQARFRREAQSSASLNHPAVVAVYDTGEEMATDGSDVAQPYIVMEYVAGRTLRDIIREGRKILPERALEITSGVLSALDYSHRAGIIHRDIKPGNVMLTPTGDVKVMDFGIARAVSDAAGSMTQTAAVVGTAQYLSPEQARGETVDSRSDVYSTGCLLYELLTGRPPFVGDSPVAVAYQHVREPATPPSHHDTELPPEIDAIVMKALAKRVEERYQSAAAMRSDIERYLLGRPVQAPAVAAVPAAAYANDPVPTTVTQVASTQRPLPQAEDEPPNRTGLLIALGVLLLVLIGLAAYFLPRLMESPPDRVQVPNLVGLTEDQARAAIGEAGLAVGQPEYATDPQVPEGRIVSQDPNRDTYVDPGSTVSYVVSSGRPLVDVPPVSGLSRADAQSQLERLELRVRMRETDSDEDEGTVVRTDPSAGTTVPEQSVVTVFYSDGPEEVPNVVGRREQQARRILEDAGFTVDVVTNSDTTKPAGTVISQSPPGGTRADQESVVTLVVSTFEPTPTPTESPSESPQQTPTGTESPILPLPTDSSPSSSPAP